MVFIGEKVDDFEVESFQNEEVKKIKLSDYKGKWVVLLFYPADFTFVCPTELSDAADLYEEFKKEGAEIMSVSTDTAFVHKAWHDNSESIKKITYPMLADPTGKVCRQFNTYLPEEGMSLRGSFIIDPDMKLVAMDVHDNSVGRNAHEILRKLQASKFVRESPGQVCPANWKPGDKTLKPGMDLVGKL
ncbi:redoxin domain-containing protein [Candidatus Woesearchaeota archaeon]|nr:redoxin domain-containing protein [Candidatus Woesearchaeota archaeon]MCF7901259.1 redoxin domain-containing protein [Candidatus Woesearchaeota archaeon]MCF8013574.1 redoxin domain-containing protein [Candidatus Woesearchaeota archaeon]